MRSTIRGVLTLCVLATLALPISAAEAPWVIRPEHQLPPAPAGADGLERGPLAGPITTTLKGVHPRILFTAERLQELKGLVQTDPEWKALLGIMLHEEADYALEHDPPSAGDDMAGDEGEELWQRKTGKRIPILALAYHLTGDAKYLACAKKYIFKSISYKTWGLGKFESADLAAGHQMLGLGLGYDWLYSALTPEERARIREVLVPRAKALAARAAGVTAKVWWREAYLQNHLCVNLSGLSATAFALLEEEPDAAAWIRLAHAKILKVLETTMDDGTSHEGCNYWAYGMIHLLEYLEFSRTLLGINLYQSGGADHPWLKNGAAYGLYLSAPRALFKGSERRCVLNFGDCGYHHAPAAIFRTFAARYPTAPLAGHAAWLARELQETGADYTYEDYFFNLACFDPRVKPVPPEALPTLRHFTDLDLAVARSGWSGTESVLAVKCGPPEGHKNVNATILNSAGHAHPDAGHFIFVSHGAYLVVDDGGASKKQTAFHNTLLVDGRGQKGDAKGGEYDIRAWMEDRRAPRILSAVSTPAEDTLVCDVAPAYPPDVGLTGYRRTFRFAKPDVVLVADQVSTAKPAALEWRFHLEGKVEKIAEGIFRVTQKDAALDFAVLAPEGVRASIGQLEGAKGRSYLSLAPPAPADRAQLVVVLRARDAKDATPFAPVLERGQVRVAAGGKSFTLSIDAAAPAVPVPVPEASGTQPSPIAPRAAPQPRPAPVEQAAKKQAPEPSAEEKVLAARRGEEFRAAIRKGVAAGRKPQVNVEILGQVTQAQLVEAAEEELVVSPGGAEFRIKWSALAPKRLYAIACLFVDDHRALYEFCAGSGLEAEAEREAFLR